MKRKGFVWLGAVAVSLLAWAAAYGGATTILKGDQLQGKPTITIVNGSGTLTLPSTTGTICHKGEACSYTVNGAASTPAISLVGTPYTGGTSTTTKPLLLLEPTGTTSTGWDTSGTLLGANAASGFTGRVADFQINGVSNGYFSYLGTWVITGNFQGAGATLGSNGINASANNATLVIGSARTYSTANKTQIQMLSGQSNTSSSGTGIGVSILPTYNQTGTAGGTDLLINRTETAVGSGSHKLLDAQVGGASKFSVERTGAVAVAEQSTPSTPSSGYVKVYPKTDKRLYVLDSDGNENAVGAGSGQGGINYLTSSTSTTNSDLEASVGDWLAYADAAGTSPVDGTGGSPTLTCTRTTSSPLRGTGSLLITKDAANRQGEGCAAPFTIDRADLAKPLMVEFDYEVASGTYDVGSDTTDPDLTAWVYGPTDGTPVVTQLAPYKVLGGTTGTQMKFQGRFQTASSGVAYRLILHEAKTGTSAYTAKLDNIKVGPEQKSFGPPITDWQSYTPTVAGFGTVSGLEAFYRRVGDSVEIRARWVSGTSTAVGATVTLPTGLSVSSDSSKLGSNPALVGKLTRGAMDTAQVDMTVLAQTGNSYLSLGFRNGSSNAMTVANGDSIASSGEGLTFFATVPVSGWSSTVQMSNDTDTRVVAAKVYLGSNFSVTGSVTDVAFNTVAFDTHGAFNTSTYTYTAPVPGYYRISSFLTWTVGGTSASDVQFLVANSANTTLAMLLRGPSSTTATQQPGSTILHLSAGDTLKFRVFQNSGGTNWQLDAGATNTSVSIERLSGPSAIAATETVAASYNTAAAQSIPNNTATTVVYGTKVVDTHGAFNASTGVYTITSSGKYRVSASINWTANGTGTRRLRIRKNGSDAIGAGVPANASTDGSIVVSGILSCVAGDTIDAQAFQNSGGALTLLNNAYDNVFSIERVGN